MGLLSQQYGKLVELTAGSTLCTPTIRANADNGSGCVRFGNICVGSENLYNTIQSCTNLHFRAAGNCPIIVGDSGSTHTKICNAVCSPILCGTTCLSTAQVIGTKVSVGSLNTNYDLYNNGTSYLNGHVTIDDSLAITGAKIMKTGGYNKPGIQMCGTGNYSFCDLNVFLKNTGAANSAIFSDYEPHGEWGLFHDNNDDAFYITAGSSCHNVGSFNMKNCAGTVRTAYIKQKFVQGNGNAEIGGSLSVSPDCSNNYNGMAIGCTYTNIGGWHTQLSMYGGSHAVARWNHGAGTDGANNSRHNCIYAHVDNPFVICSSGNIRLKPGTGTTVSCGMFCAGCVCGVTCVYSNCVYANKLQADTCVVTGDLCLTEDYSGDMSNGIQLGRSIGIPQAAWGESGVKTGRIEIGLPTKDGEGGSSHLGMIHMTVDVYEYDGNDVSTFIIGGHNWSCRWYNCGAHITGGCTNKTIKLAYHACGGTCNGRYVVLIGECDSSWNYGSVHVRRINNGLYYNGNMDMGTPMYVKRVTCSDSYYNCTTSDLRSDSKSMAAYQYATTCVHTPRVCATTCVRSSYLYSTGNICGTEICSGSWFRNANSGQGLYNSATGFHFYSTAANIVRIYGASADNIGLQGYSCGAARGCLNWNCYNQLNVYDSGGNVRFLINSNTDIRLCNTTCLHCNIYVGGRIFACTQSESLNFKGARGCFTNEYMHLYNKVGIGHPSGWGCGETNTPDKGLSTYGKACIGYGVSASTDTLKVAGGVSTLGAKALYSESYANSFYPDAVGTWNLKSASGQTHSSLRFRRGDGNIDGYVYSSTGGYIGFLDSASYWAYGHQTNACHWWNISNTTHMKLCGNCLCHCHTICAQHCLRADKVEAVSCVQSCRYQHHWRTIAIGGDYDKFYPIGFTVKGGNNSEDILEIAQPSVHAPTTSCGAMYLKLGVNITGWGHISNHYIVHKYATGGTNSLVSKVRAIDHSTCRVGVWLRGGLTYYYRSREGTIACNITGGTTASCLSYDNANNAYDVSVQYTSSVEDNNFGNTGGCNAGNAYLTHHSSLGTSVVLTTDNLQQALCCGCCTNTVCLGNCGVIKNTNFTTGVVCGNDCVRGGKLCSSAWICANTEIYLTNWVRFNTANKGLYWAGACQTHLYPAQSNSTLYLRSCHSNTSLAITTSNNTTIRGYLYGDSSNNFGFLDSDGQWAIRHLGNNCTEFRIDNGIKATIFSSCFCSNNVICAATCVHSAKICGTHYGDGSNLTGVGGGYCTCCNTTIKTGGTDCGNIYLGKDVFACGVAQGKTTGHFRNVAIGDFAMGALGCDPHSNVVIGYSAGSTAGTTCCRGCNGYCYNVYIGRNAGDGTFNGSIGGTSNTGSCNVFVGAYTGGGPHNGKNNVLIGTNSGYNMQCGASCNLFLGHGSGGHVTTGCKCVVIGYGSGQCYDNASICAACTHVATLNKSSGSFIIPHPDPAKTATTDLRHSYVESPTRGDNIYRWQVDVTNCCNVITLPSYYQFLNENDMVWVSPVEHFGSAYGKVTEDQCCAIICTNADGKYNVLLVGTRCDCMALNHWKGVEPPMESTSPALSAITEENPNGPDFPRRFVCNVRKPMSEW
tara:strand:- start:1713 stop:6500 length:4788 start_codon:yes stop_codon:yes gene_type:complete